MRPLIYITVIAHLHSFGQSDSISIRSNRTPESPFRIDSTYRNYFVLKGQDTMFFSASSTVWQCDHLVRRERRHNHWRFYADKLPMEGLVAISLWHDDAIATYSGTMLGGYYETGTFLRRAKDGSPLLTGQYLDNWKFGYWTSFSPDGKIEAVHKFIDGADEPVISWEYDETGKIIEFVDEEFEVRDRINKNGR